MRHVVFASSDRLQLRRIGRVLLHNQGGNQLVVVEDAHGLWRSLGQPDRASELMFADVLPPYQPVTADVIIVDLQVSGVHEWKLPLQPRSEGESETAPWGIRIPVWCGMQKPPIPCVICVPCFPPPQLLGALRAIEAEMTTVRIVCLEKPSKPPTAPVAAAPTEAEDHKPQDNTATETPRGWGRRLARSLLAYLIPAEPVQEGSYREPTCKVETGRLPDDSPDDTCTGETFETNGIDSNVWQKAIEAALSLVQE